MRPALILVPALLIAALVLWDKCREPGAEIAAGRPIENATARSSPASAPQTRAEVWNRSSPASPAAEPPEPLGARLTRILGDENPAPRVASHQLADFLARNGTNAFSLVAAFEATLDPEFLKRAAATFPEDPLVQARVLTHNLFPEQRQQWIEALKESSPGNSLPHLLAAVDAMEKGHPDAALAEIRSTAGKTLDDFSREGMIGLEEA